LRADFRRAPILAPSIAVAIVLVGCAGLGMFHDAFEHSLERLPAWSGIAVFFIAVSVAALLGGLIQGNRRLPEG
jgi:hypothetical protein